MTHPPERAPERAPDEAADWRGLAAILSAVTVVGIGLGLTTPLISVALKEQGASGAVIGAMAAVNALAILLVSPLVPALTRRLGPRHLFVGSVLCGVLCLLGLKATPTLAAWFPLRFVMGGAMTILFVVSESWINAITSDARRGRTLGIYIALLSLGFTIGPLVLSVVGVDGWLPFLTGAGLLALAGLPVLAAGGSAPRFDAPADQGQWRFLVQSPAIYAASFAYGALEFAFYALLPAQALARGLGPAEASLLLAATGAGNVALQIPLGWMADHLDRRLVLLICAGATVAGSLALPWALELAAGGAPWPLAAVLFLWGGLVVGFYTIGLTLLGERHAGANLASANAAYIAAYGAGALIGPLVAGQAMDLWPVDGFSLALTAIGAAILIPIARQWLSAPAIARRP